MIPKIIHQLDHTYRYEYWAEGIRFVLVAETLQEAIQSIWTSFVCLHCENANSALSIGRLDQMLQPFFLKEIEKAKNDNEKEQIIRKAIELVGSLFIRINDHDPLMPNVGWKLF